MSGRRKLRREWNPTFWRSAGGFDFFEARAGDRPVLLMVPAIQDGWPEEIKQAVERRRRATLYGRCDCGNQAAPWNYRPGWQEASFLHEHDCPASDEVLGELFQAHGIIPPRMEEPQ